MDTGCPSRRKAWRLANAGIAYAVAAPLLSLASAATGMLVPILLSPVEFGAYALVVGIFQVCVVADFGLGQLMDRRMAGCESGGDAAWQRAATLLWLRLGLGVGVAGVCVAVAWAADPGLSGGSAATGLLSAFAGLSFMVANGLVSFYRASFRHREFAVAALYLQVGLIVPRLAGILVAGSLGCFVALALWYGAAVVGLVRMLAPARGAVPSAGEAGALLLAALPLFASTLLWTLYLTANRWLSAMVSTPVELGLLSFAANLAFLLVGAVATVSQLYYPRISRQMAAGQGRPRQVVAAMVALAGGVGLAVAVADLALARIMAVVFPTYLPAVAATRFMLVSALPLALVSCLLPLLLAVGRTPWRDCVFLFGAGFAALAAGILGGDRMAGIAGQAIGCCPAALVLFAVLLWRLGRSGCLTLAAAIQIFLTTSIGVAAALALAIHQNS